MEREEIDEIIKEERQNYRPEFFESTVLPEIESAFEAITKGYPYAGDEELYQIVTNDRMPSILREKAMDKMIEKKRQGYEHLNSDFFESTVLPALESAFKTLAKSDPSNEELRLIMENVYIGIDVNKIPSVLQEEAFKILVSRIEEEVSGKKKISEEKELRLIIKSYAVSDKLRRGLALKLLELLIEQKNQK